MDSYFYVLFHYLTPSYHAELLNYDNKTRIQFINSMRDQTEIVFRSTDYTTHIQLEYEIECGEWFNTLQNICLN